MFKKIHSNRDPRDTVWSEVRKQFSPYFNEAGTGLKKTAEQYPKFLFWMMVVNITLSIVLVTTVFRPKKQLAKTPPINLVKPVSGGFDKIIEAGKALRATIGLKKQVDSITHKKLLDKADSAALLKDLDSLQHLSFTLKQQ
jgi:hypothetical protein